MHFTTNTQETANLRKGGPKSRSDAGKMTKQAVAAAALLLNAHSMAAGGTDSLTTYGLERVKGHHSMSEIDPFLTEDFFSQVELQLDKILF